MHRSIVLAVLTACASASMDITFCSDSRCEEAPLETIQIGSASGCRRDHVDTARAVKMSLDKGQDQPYLAIRLYRSVDCFATCGSGHLITTGTDGFQRLTHGEDGDASTMQSWEVVEPDDDGNYAPYGYCGLRHGDAQFFRERVWKWQQIGKDAFREVPIEDWDDEIYPRLTGTDYDMHGSVDAKGKQKMQQVSQSGWIGVLLEEWDDDMHVRNTDPTIAELEWQDEPERSLHEIEREQL